VGGKEPPLNDLNDYALLRGRFLFSNYKLNEYEDKCNFQEWCELGV
jgi:hypothetical protein